MKTRFFSLPVLIILFTLGVLQSRERLSDGNSAEDSYPKVGHLCTAFCLTNEDHGIFAANMDQGDVVKQIGQIFVNKRHVMKTGWEASTSGEYAHWISKYGSVTFNAAGYQFPWAGMNEAGLMISDLSLQESEVPAPDARPPLWSPFWIQYQLDNFSTIQEVIASDALVRPSLGCGHYLVCDKTSDCAVIEFLGGKMVAYTGPDLPVKALANSSYQDSLTALEDGNYWKVEVLDVNTSGPAAKAGVLKDDWIIAVDGVQLEGEQSMETFYAILATHQPGEEMEFTVIHPGETEAVSIAYELAPLPDDLSKYTFPPGIPVQVLSLGFFPTYPGDFITRFITAAEWTMAFDPVPSDQAATYAFEGLKAASTWDTTLSVVFDPLNMGVYLRTNRNPQIRYLDFSSLDFSCGSPVMMLDIHTGDAGDLADDLLEYSHKMAFDHLKIMAENSWQVDVSPLFVDTILTGFEGFACMDGNSIASGTPKLYVENHPPVLPPLMTWFVMLMFKRLWPAWLILTLISLVLIVWCLLRRQGTRWTARFVWIMVVTLLGPIGLVAYLLVQPRRISCQRLPE